MAGAMAGNLRERIRAARVNLARARSEGDGHGEDTFAAELEDLLRRAADHGITVDDEEQDG
ncbi:hypothetical protein GCM10022221_65350 [Actinocorallia aurea]